MEGIPEFNIMDFKIIKNLGRGSFGSVKLVENNKTQDQYAAKEQFDGSENSFQKEIKTYKKTKNAAILSLLGYSPKNFEFKEKQILFTEYMKNGSVEKIIKKDNDNVMKYIILLGVSLGMKYLHSEGIIHRDLKAGNIVLNDEMEPKICDFGSSKISDKEFTEILMNNPKGTPLYMPPEILGSHDPYNYKVDVYAFSFFAYELITGKSAFYEIENLTRFSLKKMVVQGKRPNLSIIEDHTIKNFLKKCWAQRPSDRPSFLEIVDEIMQENFKKAFGIVNQKDIEKVENYLKLFDDDLKSPNSKDALDVKKEADKGNAIAILQYAQMLSSGYGCVMNKSEALKYYKKASDLNDIKATYLYAYCLRHGEGIDKDINEAIKYYKKAASLGSHIAMINLGHMFRYGEEIPQNYEEAVKYYEQSALLGNTNAMLNLGFMMYHGEGIPMNKEKGKLLLKNAADTGNNQAMYRFGKILLNEGKDMQAMIYLRMSADLGNVEAMSLYAFTKIMSSGLNYSDQDLIKYLKMAASHGDELSKEMCQACIGEVEEYATKSAQEMKEDADDGDIQSMLLYAKMCYSGDGVELNKQEAADYFQKAADLGESHAMFELGKMLVNGDGIPENKKKGIIYLQQSVIKQDINVMYLYGQLLRKGKGIPTDKIKGANYLKMSAERGNNKAMLAYGQMLYAGEGIPKNEEEGLKFIERSTLMNAEMMTKYGKMLQSGKIVPVNKTLASEYYKKAVGLVNYKAMYLLGLMEITGDGIEMNRDDGIRLLKLAADFGFIDAMKTYAGILIQSDNNDMKKEAANYIKITSERGDKVSFFLFRRVFREIYYNSENEKEESNILSKDEKDIINPIIKVNSYESCIFENNQMIYLQNSTIPQQISDEFLEILQNYKKIFLGIRKNVIHQSDPNSTYNFYFLSSLDTILVNNIMVKVLSKYNIQFIMVRWNIDMFFDEKMIPPDVLQLLLNHLNGIENIMGVSRNIFDGRQIASYIRVNPLFLNMQEINDSIQNLLLPKEMVFNKIKYPLEKDIVINEEMMLKDKKDFDLIISEIQKIGLEQINVERNRLYLYGNYFIRKLFQTFSFICFRTENEKMMALNHINSLVYSSKNNVLKYKMNLYYGKIDDSAYPSNVRDNLCKLFQSFKGIKDIQEHVFSIENPVVRTYVGFDSLKHLKKAYNKFFHYVDILRYGINPKFFLKKKNLIYLYTKDKIDERIVNIISNYFAADVQKKCTEYNGDKFQRNSSNLLELNFFGFDGKDNYDKAVNLFESNSIQYFKYHEIKSFINTVSDIPEEYLFYDSF